VTATEARTAPQHPGTASSTFTTNPSLRAAQAYTLAISDAFILVGWLVVGYRVLMLSLQPAKFSYKDLRTIR
jgi:hypothetical protein